MTLRQAKWIFGKCIVEMFQRRQHEYRLIAYMIASTKTLRFMSAGVFEARN